MTSSDELPRTLGWVQGTALSICAVLGCGILILPAATANQVGPVSLLAWLLMSLLTFPIVLVLTRLALLQPTAGGIVAYTSLAFGPQAGRFTGWILLGSVPIGAPVIALIGAHYLTFFYPFTVGQIVLLAASLLLLSLYFNLRGIELSAKAGLILVLLILALLLTTIFSSLPHIKAAAFYSPDPINWPLLGQVTVTIFFCYSGWEMVASLAEEFKQPKRDIPYSLFSSALLIALLYLSLSIVIIGTQVYKTQPTTAMIGLMTENLGTSAGALTSLLAAGICFASVHANIAGFSRILYAQSRSGDLPSFLGKLHSKYKTPFGALLSLATFFAIMLLYTTIFEPNLANLLLIPSSCFLASYILTMASALKVLPKHDWGWSASLLALLTCLTVYLFSGWIALIPLALVLASWLYSLKRLQS